MFLHSCKVLHDSYGLFYWYFWSFFRRISSMTSFSTRLRFVPLMSLKIEDIGIPIYIDRLDAHIIHIVVDFQRNVCYRRSFLVRTVVWPMRIPFTRVFNFKRNLFLRIRRISSLFSLNGRICFILDLKIVQKVFKIGNHLIFPRIKLNSFLSIFLHEFANVVN